MSQAPIVLPNTGTLSGLDLVNKSNDALATLDSGWSGTSAPSHSLGRRWLDTATPNRIVDRFSDGADWIVAGNIYDSLNNVVFRRIGGGRNSVASAATCTIGSVNESGVNITGTTTISSFGTLGNAGELKVLTFAGALTIVHNPSTLIIPGGVNLLVEAGDKAIVECIGSGAWQVVSYTPNAVPTAYTPVITANSGTITSYTATGVYKNIDQFLTWFEVSASITNNGTGAGILRATLPYTNIGQSIIANGMELNTTLKSVSGFIGNGTNLVGCLFYDGTYPGATGYNVVVNGIIRRA